MSKTWETDRDDVLGRNDPPEHDYDCEAPPTSADFEPGEAYEPPYAPTGWDVAPGLSPWERTLAWRD